MTPERDEALRRLLHGAVDDLEPREGLSQIRARTDRARTRRDRSGRAGHHWALALGGAVAVASVIGGVAVVGDLLDGPDSPAPASSPDHPGEDSGGERSSHAVPVYYLVDSDDAGPRLVREFRATAADDPHAAALDLLQGDPLDPDYRTAWPTDSFDSLGDVNIRDGGGGWFEVGLADPALQERPDGMSGREAELALQQVVWTLQGVQQSRVPVRFLLEGKPVTRVLGVPVSGRVSNDNALDVLNHVSITTPEQGRSIDETVTLSGVANAFEATVGWELRRGADVVRDGYATMEGWTQRRLYPFEVKIDVQDLPPGDYSMHVTTGDPTAGTEGVGTMTDSKEFTIR